MYFRFQEANAETKFIRVNNNNNDDDDGSCTHDEPFSQLNEF